MIVLGLEQSIEGTFLIKIIVEFWNSLKVGSVSKIYSLEGSWVSSSFFVREITLFDASEIKIIAFYGEHNKFLTFSKSVSINIDDNFQM